MNSISKTKKTIYFISITALFSALTFALTYVQIPLGVSKIHLGNFACIIAGLLCGPIVGGISGALGMSLNDIASGYHIDTWLRTLIVKFAIGFIVGYLFRVLVKKEKRVNYIYYILISLFACIFALFLTLYLIYGEAFKIGTKTFKISPILLISIALITVLLILSLIFSNRIKKLNQYVLIASITASTINIILEFILKIPFKIIFAKLSLEGAFIYALASLPSALLTAIITTIIVTAIYFPVYLATEKSNKLNDLYTEIQNLTTIKDEKKETND